MKVSTRSRYGVAAMVDLAQQYGKGPVSLRSVAERQEISEHYLEQLIAILRKAGLVRSVRGAQGGYVLSKQPSEIRIGDIVRAMEGPLVAVDCLLADQDENNPYCPKACSCIRRVIWQKMSEGVSRALDGIILADFCALQIGIKHRERGEQQS